MRRFQAYKFELMPDTTQNRDLRRFAGACRFVYNKALAVQIENYESGKKFIGYVAMAKRLTAWRNGAESPWLKDPPCHALQYTLRQLERAYKKFFAKHAKFPKFKRKGKGDAFHYPAANQIKLDQPNSRIFLPKLGWLRFRQSRDVLGELRNVTVGQSNDRWFVSIQTQREVEKPLPSTTAAIGIDVGVARLATMSDGTYFETLTSFKENRRRLGWAQRCMSRKVKFSRNWKKAKIRVQKIYAKMANARKDFLHKITTTISKNHAFVCIEDLQIRNMVKSSKGNSEQPGKRVAQKSGLNRSILDQGWGEFRRQLAYKIAWQGGLFLAVSPHYTSQTCPDCGHISRDNRRTQGMFCCGNCGYENHADVVGAINVLARGYRVLACGESSQSGRSMKQEPTEASHKSSGLAVGIPVP